MTERLRLFYFKMPGFGPDSEPPPRPDRPSHADQLAASVASLVLAACSAPFSPAPQARPSRPAPARPGSAWAGAAAGQLPLHALEIAAMKKIPLVLCALLATTGIALLAVVLESKVQEQNAELEDRNTVAADSFPEIGDVEGGADNIILRRYQTLSKALRVRERQLREQVAFKSADLCKYL